jgi:alkaline phosphatase D
MPSSHSRRYFLAGSAGAAAVLASEANQVQAFEPAQAHLASGVKVGEVTPTGARIWARHTGAPSRVAGAHRVEGRVPMAGDLPLPAPAAQLDGACPGAEGRLRVHYGLSEELANARRTAWVSVSAETDFTHQFQLRDLRPGTAYFYAVETAAGGGPASGRLSGRFRTAPRASQSAPVRLGFINCQMFHTREQPEGFTIYPLIRKWAPEFVVFTGDNVYYDSERPRAVNAELARYHWQRAYSTPFALDLLRSTASYWIKDDHDTHSDDVFPQRGNGIMRDLTFEQGVNVFRQQVPLGALPYRTFRWGRELQIWLVEGRDFRSANTAPDSPRKSIWGAEQKAWLQKSLLESDATWKLLVSPTPLVGPDRPNKADNHSNKVFENEGREMRRWLAEKVGPRFFVICGDRHWQYHSVDPETGLREFSIGPASDAHASGTPGENPRYHRYHKVQGGYLAITVEPQDGGAELRVEHRDVRDQPAHTFRDRVSRA